VDTTLILVVDDRADIRLFLREFLHVEGFSTVEAIDADQAVEQARRERPTLIMMDVMMPGRDGLSAIQEIRAQDNIVGIIVMTAHGTEERAVRAMQVGADDYMHKPFDMAELQTKLHAVLDKSRLRIENRRLTERMQWVLSRYMSLSVADQLINAPELPSLGGERQDVTMLFADLRGFTTFAARAVPEDLIKYLNRYLSLATEAILAENGTLDKFLGDGVMALFNAPLRDTEHMFHAVRAAIAIQRNTAKLEPLGDSHEPLRFGVGVHTGEVVMGNIGAAQLMSYTAIGDDVNIAKRLEEHAKPGQIIVSENVARTLSGRLLVKPLEPMVIKGHLEAVPIYEVISLLD
jgi:adenylate cyclase